MTKSTLAVALRFAVMQPFKFKGVTHRPPGPATFDHEEAKPLIAAGFLDGASPEWAEPTAAEQAAADKAAAKKQAGKAAGKGGK